MSDIDQPEAVLTADEAQSIAARYGATAKVWELGGRRWVLKKPSRALWQAYKCDAQSMDPTTKADAGVTLARACVVPFDAAGSIDAERIAFDAMGEDAPALLDLLAALAEQLAAGPLAVREVKPPPSTPRV